MERIRIVDIIDQGLENGGRFDLDPETMRSFRNLLVAAAFMDEMGGRPTDEQLARAPEEMQVVARQFHRAIDELKAWSAKDETPAEKPKLTLVGADGEPLPPAALRRKLAVH